MSGLVFGRRVNTRGIANNASIMIPSKAALSAREEHRSSGAPTLSRGDLIRVRVSKAEVAPWRMPAALLER